ncbi:MAG: hypothetical protein HY288_09875 [Planctomycetia bacterium]|nr:hypothetical protein [Planctomycetia bacterium]
MSNFRLSCTCGQSVSVSASQAGQTVRCSCGAQLEVPTLRGLRELPLSDAPADAKRPSNWENRQRAIFSLVLISLCALALGGYLWTKLPTIRPQATPEQIKDFFAAGKPAEVYDAFQELQKGLGNPALEVAEDQRNFMAAGIEIALGIGVCGLIAAIAMTLRGRTPTS